MNGMSILETIIQAGRERKLLWMRAREKDGSVEERVVEPYSFRPPGTYERFYCYDVRKQGTRQFYLRNILEVRKLDESFVPRWPVEL
ncbi:WYL domain-containing protein [Desulfofundulus kuznetsovii]|uniref:WYL domain-containing protein n=1 Tax=Desulfofundulus kuznetsovii TaxID=58135 RepID=UPI00059BEED5